MEKSNSTRGFDDKHSKDGEFEIYLKSGLPSSQVVSLLKSQNKDQKEIDAFMERYEASKKKINKLIKKFVEKIELKYGHLDIPELMRKGIKFAAKHNFSGAEKDAFIRYVLRGDTDAQYLPYQELGYTEMSKFLGFSSFPGQSISVKAPDHAALNEIARLYEASKPIHSAVRNNLVMYRTCSPEAISGEFKRDKHNVNLFVHPLIVALFLSKIDVLEKRMLYSNIGRLVVQRTQAYFQTQQDSGKQHLRFLNSNISLNDLLPGELEADLELAYEMALDPNSLNYFSDETPMANLLKRFNVQVELWKNVLSLRQGKFYSHGESFNVDDGIMGLHKVLSSYDWTYFDSPDLYKVHDEGTMLRKLLAVFSFRPTFTQISSFVHRTGLGYSNLGAVLRPNFVNTPICNIKLPANVYGNNRPQAPVHLMSALTQSDWFIENKMLVPKNKSVIHSRKIIFFYVNRRHQTLNFANVDIGFRYLSLPGTLSGMTGINTTDLVFTDEITLGNDKFNLSSVVVLNPLLEGQLSTGCSSIVLCPPDPTVGRMRTTYLYYNPISASIMFEKSGKYVTNDPISPILDHSNDPRTPGFYETARKYGTIFVYVNPN